MKSDSDGVIKSGLKNLMKSDHTVVLNEFSISSRSFIETSVKLDFIKDTSEGFYEFREV